MKKIYTTFLMIIAGIMYIVAQNITSISASLKPDATSGNWGDPIWNIRYGNNTYNSFSELADANDYTIPGYIDIIFSNNAQLTSTSISQTTYRQDIIYKSILFRFIPGSGHERTINGASAISVGNIKNQLDNTQTFNVPVKLVAIGTELPQIDTYGPIIFLQQVSATQDLTLNKNPNAAPIPNYYVFQNTIKTNYDLNVNARTTFNQAISVGNLNIAKEAELVTFKEDVVVEGNASGNGVSNYEKKLTVKGNLTTHDTTAIQMITYVGKNLYINAPLYILDSLTVIGDIQCGNFPINLMQSEDGTRQGFLQMNKTDHIIPILNIYNGSNAILRRGKVNNMSFKKPFNNDLSNLATNIIVTDEEIGNLSFYRKANETKKLPLKGTNITITGNTSVIMEFPDPNSYYLVGFPFDVTITGTAKEICEYDCEARSNGRIGWKLVPAGTTTLKAGKGYAILSDNELTFTAANAGDKFSRTSGTQPIIYYTGSSHYTENYGWNLITTPMANPQPMQINEGMFIYRYDPSSDKYTTISSDDSFTPNPFEAFFVKTIESQTSAIFAPIAQSASASYISRIAPKIINVTLHSNDHTYETRIKYDDQASITYDALYDAPYSGGMQNNATMFYSHCVGQNGKYSINTVPESTEEVYLGYKLPNANVENNYTITWDNQAAMDLELYDHVNEIAIDMADLTSYSFIEINPQINTNRFSIRKKEYSPTTSLEQNSIPGYITVQDKTIYIQTETTSNVLICDIMGRIIYNGPNNGQQQYNIAQPGIYIVRVNGEATKIFVK